MEGIYNLARGTQVVVLTDIPVEVRNLMKVGWDGNVEEGWSQEGQVDQLCVVFIMHPALQNLPVSPKSPPSRWRVRAGCRHYSGLENPLESFLFSWFYTLELHIRFHLKKGFKKQNKTKKTLWATEGQTFMNSEKLSGQRRDCNLIGKLPERGYLCYHCKV